MPRTSRPVGRGRARPRARRRAARPTARRRRPGSGSMPRRARPTSSSPARSGAGPSPASRSVARDPSIVRRVEPAANGEVGARAVREPVEVQLGSRAATCGRRTDRPRARRGGSAPTPPVTANQRSRRATARKPPIVTSMPAAPSGLPTSRFAVRSAPRSSAPDGATPSDGGAGPPEVLDRREQSGLERRGGRRALVRARVAFALASADGPLPTRRAVCPPLTPRGDPALERWERRRARGAEPHARSRGQERGGRRIRIEQGRRGRADEPPAARGLARIRAGELRPPGPPRRAGTRVRGLVEARHVVRPVRAHEVRRSPARIP